MLDLTDERFEGMLKVDGFDEAIIGVAYRCGMEDVLAYNEHEMVRILESQGMTNEEAHEYFNYNIAGAYHGDRTPIYVDIFAVTIDCGEF